MEVIFLFELIFMILMGSLFCFLGFRIWKKQQITLIHDYHYTKVTEEDKKPYTEKMGKGVILIGIGMFLTGIIDFSTESFFGWIAFGVFFIAGLIVIMFAQIKYNHGLF